MSLVAPALTLSAEQAARLTPRERFIAALERRPIPGRVPHFELVFFLTMEAFGRVHPTQCAFHQWKQMSESERQLHRAYAAETYIMTAERYDHDAIFIHPNPGGLDETCRLIDEIRRRTGDRYFLMMHGDATLAIPNGQELNELVLQMAYKPEEVREHCERRLAEYVDFAEKIRPHGGLDGFALCSDYCFNKGPFLPLDWFDEYVTPYLRQEIAAFREMGFYVIKHTDGNMMPILDRLVDAGPHAIHSIDPQAEVDIAEVARLVGDRVALCGNVNCGLIQTGTEEQVAESTRYSLRHGMEAPGYIFCTSNCVYTGMDLKRYDLILDIWRKEGIRK